MAENNENILTRVVPHSQEAEQSVIGAMLRDKDAVSTAAEMLRHRHRCIISGSHYNTLNQCLHCLLLSFFQKYLGSSH